MVLVYLYTLSVKSVAKQIKLHRSLFGTYITNMFHYF